MSSPRLVHRWTKSNGRWVFLLSGDRSCLVVMCLERISNGS
jgi:hypothetical protein